MFPRPLASTAPGLARRSALILTTFALLGGPATQRGQSPVLPPAAALTAPWVSTWGTAPSGAALDGSVAAARYHGDNVFADQTLRLVVHASLGGQRARVRLSK